MALSEQQKQQLNVDAVVVSKAIAERGDGWYYTGGNVAASFDRVYTLLTQYYGPIYSRKDSWTKENFQDSFSETILSTLKNYDGNSDFFTYFNTSLNNRIKSTKQKVDKDNVIRNGKTEYERISVSIDDMRSDENERGESENIVADSYDLEEENSRRFELLDWVMQLCDIVMTQKNHYSNTKTYCYSPLFFSDIVTFMVAELLWLPQYLEKNSNAIDLASDIRFIRFFLSEEYRTITDAAKLTCKKLSEFTGKPDDMNKDARIVCKDKFERLQNIVYVTFMREFENKSISEAAITQHWNKFKELTNEIK